MVCYKSGIIIYVFHTWETTLDRLNALFNYLSINQNKHKCFSVTMWVLIFQELNTEL